MSAVGRWTAPGTCPWSQVAVEGEWRTTKPGSPPAASAEATSETSAWKARLAPKWATASAGDAGATRSTGFVLFTALVTVVSTVTVMVLPSLPAPADRHLRGTGPTGISWPEIYGR